MVESVGSLRSPRRDRAIDLAPHVGELLGERERCPASRGEISVSRHPGTSAFHQPGDDLANAIPQSAILDIARTVPLRRADVDQRIELDPRVLPLGRIEIDAPQMLLRRPILDQRRFFVGMQLTARASWVGEESRSSSREYSGVAGETASGPQADAGSR